MAASESKTRNLLRNGTPRAKVLELPGFIWQVHPEKPHDFAAKAYRRGMTNIKGREAAGVKNLSRIANGVKQFTGNAVRLMLDACPHNMTMKTDDAAIWIEYKGVKLFMTEAAFLRSGVPAEFYESPKPVDILKAAEDIMANTDGGVIKVRIHLQTFGLDESALARTSLEGWATEFEDVRKIGEALYHAKLAQAPELCAALEIEVRGGIPYQDFNLTLWYPAKNDVTAEGYGVSVGTDAHEAAIARIRAQHLLEGRRQSKEGIDVTLCEATGGRNFIRGIDPIVMFLKNAPGMPWDGWTYTAFFHDGITSPIRPITGGNPYRDGVILQAQKHSALYPNALVRVYCLQIPTALDPNATVPSYVFVPDGSARMIVSKHPVTCEAVFQGGESLSTEYAGTPPAQLMPSEPRPVENFMPAVDVQPAPAAPAVAAAATLPAEGACLQIYLRASDIVPVQNLHKAAQSFVDGFATIKELVHAVNEFRDATQPAATQPAAEPTP